MEIINLTGKTIQIKEQDGATIIIRPTSGNTARTIYSTQEKVINGKRYRIKVPVDIANIPENTDDNTLYIVNESVFLETKAENIITPEYGNNKEIATGFRVHSFKHFEK